MTNEPTIDILGLASQWHWPSLYIDPTTTIGPGQEQWEHQLPLLTDEQRQVLETKISRQLARLATERSTNVSPAAIQRVAKSTSNAAPRGQDRSARSTTTGRRSAARRSGGKR